MSGKKVEIFASKITDVSKFIDKIEKEIDTTGESDLSKANLERNEVVEELVTVDDDVIEFENFSVLLDSMSYPYLYGSTLDFVEDLSGSKFIISNPNAKTTCGCGESFTI